MNTRCKECRTSGFSVDEEDPIFVWPGLPYRAQKRHGTIGWKCDLQVRVWREVIYDSRRHMWIAQGPEVLPFGLTGVICQDRYDD